MSNDLEFVASAVPKGKGLRQELYGFDAGGELNALRWGKWKVTFSRVPYRIANTIRKATRVGALRRAHLGKVRTRAPQRLKKQARRVVDGLTNRREGTTHP